MKTKLKYLIYQICLSGLLISILYVVGYPTFITNISKLQPISLEIRLYLQALGVWPISVFVSIVFFSLTFKESLSKWLSHLKISHGDTIISSEQQKSDHTKNVDPPISDDQQSKQVQLSNDDVNLKNLVQQWREAAYLWEYSYLNYFLALSSKHILLWLYDLKKVSTEAANARWSPLIPSLREREAILKALTQHHLVLLKNNDTEIEITPKGREYVDVMLKSSPSN